MLLDELRRRFPDLDLVRHGAWAVGGAVRDLLAGRDPADLDVASPDPEADAESIARRHRRHVIRLGREAHLSAWRVVTPTHVYDFAPILADDIHRDLARRDFTVNAMAVGLDSGSLRDPWGGRRDLAARVVRMVQPANFDDDPLRMLKGVRLAITHDFDIDPATVDAIRQRARRIADVAPERVTYELTVIFSRHAFRRALALLSEAGLDAALFGRRIDASRFHADGVPLAASLALLVDSPRTFAERWRWSEELTRRVVTLQQLAAGRGDLRVALYDAGEDVAAELAPMLRALGRDDRVAMPDFSIRPLLTGNEICAVTGVAPGPELGRIKRRLVEAQVRGEVRIREDAEALVRVVASNDPPS